MIGSCGAVLATTQQKVVQPQAHLVALESHKSNAESSKEILRLIESGRSLKTTPSSQSSLQGGDRNRDERPVTAAMMRMIPEESVCPMLFPYRMRVFEIICWYPFDYFIGVVIMMNAATVGIEQTLRYEGKDRSVVDILEQCFLTVYLVELGMRVFACGSKCFHDNYVRFDIVLVALGLLSLVADAVLVDADQLGPLMILRTGRLLRLARTARLLIKFRELWIMVRGLMTSLGTIIYTMLLLLLILYTFSCISMEVITPLQDSDDIEVKEIVSTHFSNLPQTMLTLLQFVCLDSIASIYKPLIEHQPWLVFFFVTFIVVVPIVLMNLVTAVVVNGALENAQQDKDALAVYERQQKQRLICELRQVFERIDEDGSGMLSPREILRMNAHDLDLLKHLTSMDEPMDIVHVLDVDGDGDISIDEFLNGLWQVVVSKVPAEMRLELKRMQKEARAQSKETRRTLEKLQGQVGRLSVNTQLPTGHVAETAEYAVFEQTPAWAELMMSELRAFRKDCSGSLFKPPCASYESHDSINVDSKEDSSRGLVASLSTTIQHHCTYISHEIIARDPPALRETPMVMDDPRRSTTPKMNITSERYGVPEEWCASPSPKMDISSPRRSSVHASALREQLSNELREQLSYDIENQMVEI